MSDDVPGLSYKASQNGDFDGKLLNGLPSTFLVMVLSFLLVYSKFWQNSKKGWVPTRDKKAFDISMLPGPTPSKIPFVGNLIQISPIRESFRIVLNWSRQYGPLLRLYGAGKTAVLLNSPKYVHELYKSSDISHVGKFPILYGLFSPLIINAVLVSEGKLWKQRRKVLMKSIISYQSIRAYMPMVIKQSSKLVQNLDSLFQDGKAHTISCEINIVFFNILVEMMTGVDMHNTNAGRVYSQKLKKWEELLAYRILNPWLLVNFLWQLHPGGWSARRALKSINTLTYKLVLDHKKKRAENQGLHSTVDNDDVDNNNPSSKMGYGNGQKCMLDDLIDLGLADWEVVDELNFMLLAGSETSASTLHHFCLLMTFNPNWQKVCQQEVDDLDISWDKDNQDRLKYENLHDLKYLEWCLQETLRLYPPIFAFGRELKAPLKLDENIELPNGSNVLVSPFLLHRNPEYFPDPDTFDPLRFSPDESAKRHPSAYIPFSGGPRNCFGFKFAMMQLKVTCAYVLKHFDVYTTENNIGDVALLPNLILTPERDYNFVLKKRI